MNHELLKTIIFDQHELIRNTQVIPRDYRFEKNANYILTGLRRAGKSMILFGMAQELVKSGVEWEQIIYINFEDERLAEFHLQDFQDIVSVQSELTTKEGYYFFDEIQNIDGWEKFARRMADARERVYITGSNAKMLSREFESILGGRYLTCRIQPYSFKEYLTAKDIPFDKKAMLTTRTRGKIVRSSQEYLKEGGLPESLSYRFKRSYVESVYQKVFLGDIIARYQLRNPNALRILIKKIAESVMTELSYTRLHHVLKSAGVSISKDSVIDYVRYAEEAYLCFRVNNDYAKLSERESVPRYFFQDNGLLRLFLDEKDTALLENAVAVHLRRQYGDDLVFLKSSKTGVDVDFYLPSEKCAIQVAHTIQGDARNREAGNLLRLKERAKEIKHFKIITHEEEGMIDAERLEIEVIPIYQFLLN